MHGHIGLGWQDIWESVKRLSFQVAIRDSNKDTTREAQSCVSANRVGVWLDDRMVMVSPEYLVD